jgi:hypothetical protein
VRPSRTRVRVADTTKESRSSVEVTELASRDGSFDGERILYCCVPSKVMRRLHFSISKRIILAFVATTSVLSVQARAFAATSHALMRDGRTPSSTTTAATATTLRAVLSPTITTVAGSSSSRKITGTLGLLVLRGGGNAVSPGVPHISDLAMGAYEWCVNLCAPSALVAGAVIATIYENIGSGALDIRADSDTRWVMFGKRITRLLLLSAFAFEVLSIFVTTVTGTFSCQALPT